MGVHESIIPAAVATIVPANRRPSAYGLFTGAYGLFWFLGSALMGIRTTIRSRLSSLSASLRSLQLSPAYQGEWIEACCCHIGKSSHGS